MSKVDTKLKEIGIEIPVVAKPAASYVPYQVTDGVVYVSGQLPSANGEVKYKGILGRDVSIDEAKEAAKLCAINLLAAVKDACGGNLDKVQKTLHLQVLVASTPDFNSRHLVANGASDFMVEALGKEAGSHTRAAFGIASIPLGACVEIAATFKIRN